MSYQGHERHRRRRGKDPDGSRRRDPRQERDTVTYWAGGGNQNAPAWPGATDYQDPAAYRDSAFSQNGGPEAVGGYQGGFPGGGYEDPRAFPGTAGRQGARYPGSAPFPGSGYPATEDPGSGYPATEDPGSGYSATEDPGSGYSATEDDRSGYPATEHDGYRYPATEDPGSGYSATEHDRSGYPATEHDRSRYPATEHDRSRYPATEHDRSRYPATEHDRSRYPGSGYSGSGYPGSGYQNAGYQESGPAAPGSEQGGAYQPAGYADYPDYPDYPDNRGYRAATAYREPTAPGGLAHEPGGYQDPASDGGYLPAGEHPSLPGVKLADLGPQDSAAYEGLQGYLRGDGTGRADASMWRRRGRGFLAGICTGLLAGAVAIGVAVLAAAFVRPQASPVIAVGDAVLGGASQPLKAAALQSFGENYKVLLLGVIYAVIALLVMGFGLLARRRLAGGVIGMAALGAVGAFVALTRPESHATDVIPSLVGGAAGAVALALLVRAGEPQLILAVAAQRARGGHPAAGEPEVVGTNRRNFLLAGLSAAGAAVVAGVAGQVLTRQRFNVNSSGNAVAIPAPVQKAPPLKPGAELNNIQGISPFYTPNATFYRVDTALVVPQVTTAQWQLRIHGMVDRPVTINFDDLMTRPQIQRDITICCVSESVGGSFIGNARWQGTLLASLLREAGIHPAATQIVMRDVQGMAIGVSTEAVMDGRDAMLAVAMNGAPLPAEHGFPVRVVVPGLYGYVSACKWVVDMELTTYAAYDAYWVKRGWSEQAAVKTESRIDTPKVGTNLAAGQVVVAGVAWAMHKGIASVQVGIDGVWQEATLATQDTIDTWRQWYYRWDATPGAHKIQVRATDQTGYTQTAVVQAPEPNGATGYHTIKVTVA
jgi:DMSO/TMAO reductase YedYZ molybdopterin-dependent catalytic subunit